MNNIYDETHFISFDTAGSLFIYITLNLNVWYGPTLILMKDVKSNKYNYRRSIISNFALLCYRMEQVMIFFQQPFYRMELLLLLNEEVSGMACFCSFGFGSLPPIIVVVPFFLSKLLLQLLCVRTRFILYYLQKGLLL